MTAPDMPPMKLAKRYTQMFLKFQKAMAGPSALAGFMAPPVKGPAAKDPTTTARPMASGAKGAGKVTCANIAREDSQHGASLRACSQETRHLEARLRVASVLVHNGGEHGQHQEGCGHVLPARGIDTRHL